MTSGKYTKTKEHREKIALAHQGLKHTEETKKTISEKRKKLYKEGKIPRINSGCFKEQPKLTPEQEQRRIKNMKGKAKSDEHKRKLSLSMKGRHSSPKTEFKKGIKPWNYIDGRSKLRSPLVYGDDWEKIRYLVYLRDRFTCQRCGIKKKKLDVHHKIPFLISRDNSLDNLTSLCRSCHMKTDMEFKSLILIKNKFHLN